MTASPIGPVRHPDPSLLAAWAAGEGDHALGGHVRSCPACAAEVAALRSAMAAVAASDEEGSGPDCLDPDAIAALAEGGLTAEERRPLLSHAADCGHCRAAVAAVAGALSDDAVAREIRSLDARRPLRGARLAGVVAAAGLVLVLLRPASVDDGTTVHRSRSPATAPAPELVAPIGPVAAAELLQWRSVPGADVYRFSLYDAAGSLLHESVIPDTMARLPESVRLAAGQTYHWTVAARTGWNRWAVAELAAFTPRESVR